MAATQMLRISALVAPTAVCDPSTSGKCAAPAPQKAFLLSARSTRSASQRSLTVRSAVDNDKGGLAEDVKGKLEGAVKNTQEALSGTGAPPGADPKVGSDRINEVGSKIDVFEGGRAQEVLNGRAAMIGFVAALVAEVFTGKSVFEQLQSFNGVPLFLLLGTLVAVFVGSFAPRVNDQKENGLDTPAVDQGLWSQRTEIINGRSAMIGFVALLITEAIKGSALF